MRPTVFACTEIGKIIEHDFCYPASFSVVKKYPVVYAENLHRFSCEEQVYALPFGKTPVKIYRGTDREGLSEYADGIKEALTDKEKALLERMNDWNADGHSRLLSKSDAELFLGLFHDKKNYEIIHTRVAGSAEEYPLEYDFLGYDICYEVECWGAFSIIGDCMFICRWHGCDEEGTLFREDFDKLNENGLFDSFEDAYGYMVKYLNEDWSEKGEYSIFEVRGSKDENSLL